MEVKEVGTMIKDNPLKVSTEVEETENSCGKKRCGGKLLSFFFFVCFSDGVLLTILTNDG